MKNISFIILILIGSVINSFAQGNLTIPDQSQKAGVSQRIGLTDIEIHYSSPLVRARSIWGDVVPFGEVWRAGANENTTISFSTDVIVGNIQVPAGKYGLHMIPRKDKWTIILSKNASSWGSFFYNKEEDMVRFEVEPLTRDFQEWLSYRFTDPKPGAVNVTMNWEKIAISFPVSIKIQQTVVASMRNELRGVAGFTWQGPWQAADYCMTHNIYPEEAMQWIDQSLAVQENFHNLETKSLMLAKAGKQSESAELHAKAIAVANETQLNTHGYKMLGNGDLNGAVEIFKLNIKRNPNSWNVYDSYAEGLLMKGDKKGAISNYQIALSKAPEAQKNRITTLINNIKSDIK
ncbi:MAG: DUF2911 domain-containing protein [Bacteroidetes bacterium]|nr:DUF2911 domain-containing protein [Bacteroidota bacterium]